MHDTLRRFAAGAAHLALSAGLLWMGHGLAQAQPHNSPSATAAKSAAPTTAASAAALYGQHCASCHGANFSTPLDGSMPKLAGQHSDYLYAALKAYAQPDDSRVFGRSNAIMAGIVKGQFTLPQLRQIADYIGSLPGDVKTVPESRFRK